VSADNVVDFNGITKLDLNPDRVLAAAAGTLKSVVIVGEKEDGEEYFASSVAEGPLTLWMLERAKLKLLKMVEEFQA
jgi:hypothetical protein